MALPYTPLIESLEREVERGTFTAWAFANRDGLWSSHFADEACPPDWLLDEKHPEDSETSQSKHWFPAFDLASLSKPLLANAWLRMAFGGSAIPFAETALSSLLEPRSEEGILLKSWANERPWLTLGHLLNHTSGLPAWCWFGRALWQFSGTGAAARTSGRLPDFSRDESGNTARNAQRNLTQHILSLAPSLPQSKTLYSDLNYYLLARICENLAMVPFRGWGHCIDSLNAQWNSEFWHASLDPERSMTAIPFFPYVNSQVVAHVYEHRKLDNHAGAYGSAHDTNANILSSEFKISHKTAPLVSSHAGLFGSILDVKNAIPFLMETQQELLEYRKPFAAQSERFIWGLDTPSNAQSTAGLNEWPITKQNSIFGHLGYTGTSLWMADDGQFHVLLTNRTARRSTRGAQSSPRILLFQANSSQEPECWVRHASRKNPASSADWQSLHWREAYTACFEQFRLVTRYWDRNALRTPPDLANLRRTTGQYLWTH